MNHNDFAVLKRRKLRGSDLEYKMAKVSPLKKEIPFWSICLISAAQSSFAVDPFLISMAVKLLLKTVCIFKPKTMKNTLLSDTRAFCLGYLSPN